MGNRNTIIGLVLIFLIFIGFMWWQAPSAKERAEMKHQYDSALIAQRQADSIANLNVHKTDSLSLKTDSLSKEKAERKRISSMGFFSNSATGEKKTFQVENEVYKLNFSTLGGQISSVLLTDYKTFEGKPLYLLRENDSLTTLAFQTTDKRVITTKELYFKPFVNGIAATDSVYFIKDNDSITVSLRAYANNATDSLAQLDENKYIELKYVVFGKDYKMKYSVSFFGLDDVVDPTTDMYLTFENDVHRHEKSAKNEYATSSIYYKSTGDESVESLKDGKDEAQTLKTPLKWISFKQQFFSTTLIADAEFSNADIETNSAIRLKDPENYLCRMSSEMGVPYNIKDKNHTINMSFYFGPNKYNILKKYDLDLERQIPLGWGILQWINKIAVIPVFNFFEQFGWNYGIIILILTIILKIVLLPLAYKSYSSSAKMKILQPDVAEINNKYPKKEQALEKQKAVMALYKKAGASPLSGCIPMILQFPILIAMFRFFPASIELRQQSFLWANDLSSYDSIISWDAQIPFISQFYGNHISLFCLLMCGANVVYTIMNMKQSAQNNAIPGMKIMMYMMPVMLLFMFNGFAAGLNYYYFISTCITFLQMFIIRRLISEEKIRERIRVASAKPVKKSGFMERIEQMQKQSQALNQQRQQQKRK